MNGSAGGLDYTDLPVIAIHNNTMLFTHYVLILRRRHIDIILLYLRAPDALEARVRPTCGTKDDDGGKIVVRGSGRRGKPLNPNRPNTNCIIINVFCRSGDHGKSVSR